MAKPRNAAANKAAKAEAKAARKAEAKAAKAAAKAARKADANAAAMTAKAESKAARKAEAKAARKAEAKAGAKAAKAARKAEAKAAAKAARAEATRKAEAKAQVKAAEAGGWRLITGYVPCIAAHYIKNGALANPFDPSEPEILLYDGTNPDSHIVGLSYLVFATPTKAPEGFVGDEPWHIHESLCIGSQVVGDESTSDEECAKRGGRNVDLGNLWMNHMWPVAGWESRWGLFSSENPDLGGTFGNING